MFYGAYTDCYILYRATRYLIAFLGIFIFVGCVTVGTVFADLCNKKETARKNLTVSRQFYCAGDIIRIIPISCKKAAVSQSDSPTQRPFRFWLRLTASVHRRPCVPDGHRLHDAAAVGDTVAGFFVHMKAGLFIMRSGKVIFFAHFLLTCSVPCDIFITQSVRNFSPHFIVWYIFIHKKGTFL